MPWKWEIIMGWSCMTSHKLWVSVKDMKLQILCSSNIIFIFKKCVNQWSMFDTSNSIHCHCYNINDIMLFFMMKWMCNMMFVFHRIIIHVSWIYILFSLKKIYEYSSGKNCAALCKMNDLKLTWIHKYALFPFYPRLPPY